MRLGLSDEVSCLSLSLSLSAFLYLTSLLRSADQFFPHSGKYLHLHLWSFISYSSVIRKGLTFLSEPTPVFLLGKSHGQRSLEGYSPWGCWDNQLADK